jgi:hypothetical protein
MKSMISLSDSQMQLLTDVAANLAVDRRAIFLERVGAMLRMRGRFNDADVADVAALALCGLVHQRTDAA